MTRQFATGATRDADDNKLDYEGFLSPAVLECFAQYMHKARLRNIPAGQTIRASDNWQKGIPLDAYMKSGLRHVMEWWNMHREGAAQEPEILEPALVDTLCAILFNVQGYLFELLKARKNVEERVGQTGTMPGLQGSPCFDTQVEKMRDLPQGLADAAGEAVRNLPGSIESNWNGTERRGLAEGSVGFGPGDRGDSVGGSEGFGGSSFPY